MINSYSRSRLVETMLKLVIKKYGAWLTGMSRALDLRVPEKGSLSNYQVLRKYSALWI
jgi:hypothetical protein